MYWRDLSRARVESSAPSRYDLRTSDDYTAVPPSRVVLVLAALSHPLGAMTQRDRSSYLDWMVKSLPSAPQFEQWQQRTGELPPDFDTFPRNNFLPTRSRS
jgi:hypothetical protein